MRTLVPLLALLTLFAAPAAANGEDRIRLDGATVVASPGVPAALHRDLPGGEAPRPLTWPLPDGPLLVLGLPETDEDAYGLALLWNLLPPDGDLHGGYVVAAWNDGHRPILVVLGADPAALYVAREALRDGSVPAGWRHERPLFRTRVLATGASGDVVKRAVEGRANEVWLWATTGTPAATALYEELGRFGIPLRSPAEMPPFTYVEEWDLGSRTPLPSRPRGREPELHRRHDVIVVPMGPSAEVILRDAWSPRPRARDPWEAVLLPLLPRGVDDPRAFLEAATRRLEREAKATDGAVPWMRPLAAHIRRWLAGVTEPVVLVPRVPDAITVDGRLTERAWAWAAPIPLAAHPAQVFVVADGRELAIAVRSSARHDAVACSVGPADAGAAGQDPVRSAERVAGRVRVTEAKVGRGALAGDAHPTRVFALWIEGRRVATLVLGP